MTETNGFPPPWSIEGGGYQQKLEMRGRDSKEVPKRTDLIHSRYDLITRCWESCQLRATRQLVWCVSGRRRAGTQKRVKGDEQDRVRCARSVGFITISSEEIWEPVELVDKTFFQTIQ